MRVGVWVWAALVALGGGYSKGKQFPRSSQPLLLQSPTKRQRFHFSFTLPSPLCLSNFYFYFILRSSCYSKHFAGSTHPTPTHPSWPDSDRQSGQQPPHSLARTRWLIAFPKTKRTRCSQKSKAPGIVLSSIHIIVLLILQLFQYIENSSHLKT